MAKVTKEWLESILPDWEVSSCGDGDFELSSYSPAGENIVMSLDGDTFDEMARFAEGYYNDFDPAGAPDDLEDLLEDAKAIDEMYYSVYQKLCKAYEEGHDDGDDSEEE